MGFKEGINLDLIYGLPEQRLETFETNLDQILGLRPDRVALYSFAFVPWIRGHQKKLDEDSLPSAELKLQLYLHGDGALPPSRVRTHRHGPFRPPRRRVGRRGGEGRLHRNFMGYSVMPASDMIAFGISGIGEVQGAFFQNEKKLSTYYEALDDGRLPVQRGYVLDEDDRIRQHVIREIMCNFRVSKVDVSERFGIEFDEYFSRSLERLQGGEGGRVRGGDGREPSGEGGRAPFRPKRLHGFRPLPGGQGRGGAGLQPDGMRRVVIVGGGIGGLTTALHLKDGASRVPGGLEVLVLEASSRPGGNIQTDRIDGFTIERGPNGYLDNVPTTPALVRRLGLQGELQTGGRNGRPTASSTGTANSISFPRVPWGS